MFAVDHSSGCIRLRCRAQRKSPVLGQCPDTGGLSVAASLQNRRGKGQELPFLHPGRTDIAH